jgi:hypothetical protein
VHRHRILQLTLLAAVALGGCRQVITPNVPPSPPFPPEFDSVVTLPSGLILRASGSILSRNPTTLEIVGSVENPTEEEIRTLGFSGECRTMVAGFWAARSAGRILQPLDGFVEVAGGPVDCEQMTAYLRIPAGETIDLSSGEDLIPSELLGEAFAPGRHIFTVVFVDDFLYQALALDVFIDD